MQRYDVELKNGEVVDVGAGKFEFVADGILAFYNWDYNKGNWRFELAYNRNEWKAITNGGDDAATDDE
jgi:hypothetical protein